MSLKRYSKYQVFSGKITNAPLVCAQLNSKGKACELVPIWSNGNMFTCGWHKHILMKAECSICSNVILKDEVVTTCNHSFHRSCLDKWAQIKPNCPNCRRTFVINETLHVDLDTIQMINIMKEFIRSKLEIIHQLNEEEDDPLERFKFVQLLFEFMIENKDHLPLLGRTFSRKVKERLLYLRNHTDREVVSKIENFNTILLHYENNLKKYIAWGDEPMYIY
jgi:hypothetical protein